MDKVDNKPAKPGSLVSQEDAESFLRSVGLTVHEEVVRQVVNTVRGRSGRSLYDLHSHGKYADGRERRSLCGKGTAYKIKNLLGKGALAPYLEYLAGKSELPEERNQRAAGPFGLPSADGEPAPKEAEPPTSGGMSFENRFRKIHDRHLTFLESTIYEITEKQQLAAREDVLGSAFRLMQDVHGHVDARGLTKAYQDRQPLDQDWCSECGRPRFQPSTQSD